MNRWRTAAAVATAVAAVGAVAADGASAATVTPPAPIAPPGMTVQAVTNGPGNQYYPAVNGSLVTYTDDSSGTPTIHYHDLGGGTDNAIPTNGGSDIISAVYGGTVAYTHVSGGTQQIYTFDTGTAGPPTPVDAATNAIRDRASIGGGTIAWEDYTATGARPPRSSFRTGRRVSRPR